MKNSSPELPDDWQGQIAALQTALVRVINNSLEANGKIDMLSERIKNLEILQKQSDERLNAVILMAEKFFSGENGNSKKKK